MKTNIYIKNLKVDTIIGICEWEQYAEQALIFNVEMGLKYCDALYTDSIDDALDYAAVASDIESVVTESSAKLLEGLLKEVAINLFARYDKIEELSISIDKPQAIPAAEAACVELSLNREEVSVLDGLRPSPE